MKKLIILLLIVAAATSTSGQTATPLMCQYGDTIYLIGTTGIMRKSPSAHDTDWLQSLSKMKVRAYTGIMQYRPSEKPECNIYVDVDDHKNIRVEGDTMQALKGVCSLYMELIERNNKVERGYRELLAASAKFADNIPEPYRSLENCRWKPFWAILKRNGYYITQNTKPRKRCY